MIRRREFLAAVTAAAVAPSSRAWAQTPRKHRVAWLAQGDRESTSAFFEAVRAGLREVGYDEGKNLVLDARWADWSSERTEALAAELAALRPAAFVTQGGAARVASRVTPPIPVVFVFSGDAVAAGLVASVARPGRHATGVQLLALELVGKRMEILKEIVPGVNRVGVLANPNHVGEDRERAASKAAADRLGVKLSYHPATNPAELDAALVAAGGAHVDAIVVFPDSLMLRFRGALATFGLRHRIPLIAGWAPYAESGALASYGPNLFHAYRRSAYFVDRIIKGTSPAELPVELPTTFEMVVNRRTARALNVSLPQSVLLRADRIVD
jgi:putative ABC transport system substrate-binding protein